MFNHMKIDLSIQKELEQKFILQGKCNKGDIYTPSEYEGCTIVLLTLDELKSLKHNNPNDILISIFGKSVKAIDCDEDTRMGYVAFGKLLTE